MSKGPSAGTGPGLYVIQVAAENVVGICLYYVISNVYPEMLLGIHSITMYSVIDALKEQSLSVNIVQ
mgnify:CR=1 FL=1